ncbi:MAG: hypothetical protein J6O70_00035, partial [Lachnospiraceae bacterium]|nr:hypothetical protein [Lachnospiraceae bacterium]
SAVASKYSIKEEVLRRAVALSQERSVRESLPERRKPSFARQSDVKDESAGTEKAERYLLTWMSEDRRVYDAVRPYLEVEDYSEGVVRDMAAGIYSGYERGDPKIADILTRFAENDNAAEAAGIISERIDAIESDADRQRALTDLVIKIKKTALERRKNEEDGMDPLKKAVEEKKAFEKLKNIRISF